MSHKAVNVLLIILVSSSLTNGVRRKSKIDLPITNAADAPQNDNLAQASTSDGQTMSEQQPQAQALANTEKPVIVVAPAALNSNGPSSISGSSNDQSGSSEENEPIECDPDMIGFEIITGYEPQMAYNYYDNVSVASCTNDEFGVCFFAL